MNKLKNLKRLTTGIIVTILILTILEFPAPIGFEVRPQDYVSRYWLILFLAILVSEMAAIPLIFKRPLLGAKLAILAATLNIIQIVADQLHLMQPEIAPLGYLLLEDAVGLFSLMLAYFSWKLILINKAELEQKPMQTYAK